MNILVCDCGTSACRVSLVDGETGRRRVERAQSLPEGVWQGSWVDLECLWGAVREGLVEISNEVAGSVDVITVTTFFGYAYLDVDMRSLGLATSWMDANAEREARTLARRLNDVPAAGRIGRRLTGELLLPKLMRMAAVEPERYTRIRHVVGIKDEILRRLTGEIGTDYAHADYSGGFDPTSRMPVAELWEASGVPSTLLPEPVSATASAGRLTREVASATGLRAGTPVARATSDGSAAMYGCGIMIPGVAGLVSGTTDVLMTHASASVNAFEMNESLTVNASMIGDGTLVGGAMGFSGGAAAWVAAMTRLPMATLEAQAASIPAGSDGLLMVPSLTGERSPFWNPDVHGAWIGIRPSHSAGHLFRSCLEGSAVRAAILLDRLTAAGNEVNSLCIGGGGSRSALWNQIRSDATALPVCASSDAEATIRGSALLCLPLLMGGAVSEEWFAETSRHWMQPVAWFEPRGPAHETYLRACRLYEQALDLLSDSV